MYGFDDLLSDLKNADGRIFCIGRTFFNRPIIAVICGEGAPLTLIHGGIHARENVTSRLVADQIKNHKGRAVCFVPTVNPDGAEICKRGLAAVPEKYRAALRKINGSDDFSMWKANGKAVDINVNFDAGWGEGKSNVGKPSPENYTGARAESEAETRALVRLTKLYGFVASVSYHAKGEVVYHGFRGNDPFPEFARRIAERTGYALSESEGSAGGYKDWFVNEGFGPGLTIEVGRDDAEYPLSDAEFERIREANRDVPRLLAETGFEIARIKTKR